MLTEMGGTTTGQMGYSGAFQAMTADEDDDDSIATLNVEYANYAAKQSHTDSTVSGLSEQTALLAQQLAQMQAQLQAMMMNPPQQQQQAAYFAPQPAILQWPPAQQQQQVPTQIWQQQQGGDVGSQSRKHKKRKGTNPNFTYTYNQQGGGQPTNQMQWGATNQGWSGRQQQPQVGANGRPTHTNKKKFHNNLLYCFTCGYDVDHPGNQCPKGHMNRHGHQPNVPREMAHTVQNACQKGGHKMLPDGSGLAQGFILEQNLQKNSWTMNQGWKKVP